MTRTHEVLGDLIDRIARPLRTNLREEHKAVFSRENIARGEGEDEFALELASERAIIDLNVPAEEHYSLFRGGEFEDYAEFYGLTDKTIEYARQRIRESSNLLTR